MKLKITVIPLIFVSSIFAQNLKITTYPYLHSGLYTQPVLPTEGESIKIIIYADCEGKINTNSIECRVKIYNIRNETIEDKVVLLKVNNKKAGGEFDFPCKRNGIYKVNVILDPENKIKEKNENDNEYELTVAIVKRKLHFAWYRENPEIRWATCITSVPKENIQRLAEHGVVPLYWAFGGMSWRWYDKKKTATQPAIVLKELEEKFYKMYSNPNKSIIGFGIDETGGYSGTFAEKRSIASMKALIRAKEEMPERFFAVWHGGGVREDLARYYRQACDLLLLETYIWRAIPHDLSVDDVYQCIRDRLDPFIRGNDMIVPAYGNRCYTLIALDTSERPDYIDVGEQEQVVRFIRRICPEMRGIAWYNGGYGGYGLKRTKQTDIHHRKVIQNADKLCFEYYIKPCITLMRESLWVGKDENGRWELTLAVSNIGGVDSGKVRVKFFVDNKEIGSGEVGKVSAGNNRIKDRGFVKCKLPELDKGMHRFSAKIVDVEFGTVLDGEIIEQRFID